MSVGSHQRFKAKSPCPVCGGHNNLPQHQGQRCHGFRSADGRYAHCAREEYANGLILNESSNTFAHLLDGPCQCGRTHGDYITANSNGFQYHAQPSCTSESRFCELHGRGPRNLHALRKWQYCSKSGVI